PHSIIYPDIGWAVLRDSWDRDATLLAVKSGDTWNHAHADAGSFILFHAGRPLLIDAGSCSYGRPEYRGYYARSAAHNVVLYFVADGSYLRRDGQVVLHAFSKISAVIKPGAAAEVQFQGQRHVEATLLALQAPGALRVNGQPTSFDHQPAARTLRFRHRST
ncbi:MAG: heparinase II/III domain-containing protein, partial [Opitutaceae bacterium]